MFFKKHLICLPSITKSQFLLTGSGTTITYGASNTKFSLKRFNYFKIIWNFFNSKKFPKKCQKIQKRKKKKHRTNSDMTPDSLTEKPRISQFIAKFLLKQQSISQIRHCLTWHIQIWNYFFLSKETKVFQWFSKSKFLNFMTKVNPNNGNDTTSDIFLRDIFKSDVIYFFGKKY